MKKAISVHAIAFDKFLFTEEQALTFAQANDFDTKDKKEDDNVIAFIQRDRADFEVDAFGEGQDFKSVHLAEGVVALIGMLLEGITKKEGDCFLPNQTTHKTFFLTKVDHALRVVTGPVLIPDVVDLQGDFEFAEDIQKAAHGFMEDARNIGEMHTKFGKIGVPVESWLLRDFMFVDTGKEFKIFPPGTWMMSVHVTDDKVWEKVRNGELTGFSIGFRGTREVA